MSVGGIWLYHHCVVFGCPLHQRVGRDLVIEDHRLPAVGFSLRADDSTQRDFGPLLQNLKQHLDLPLVCTGVEQEIIQNQQSGAAELLHPLLVFGVVRDLEGHKLLQQRLTVVVLHPIAVAGGNANGLSQVGLTAVRRTQNADIQTGIYKVKCCQCLRNPSWQIDSLGRVEAVGELLGTTLQRLGGADIFLDWLCNHPKALSVLPRTHISK